MEAKQDDVTGSQASVVQGISLSTFLEFWETNISIFYGFVHSYPFVQINMPRNSLGFEFVCNYEAIELKNL